MPLLHKRINCIAHPNSEQLTAFTSRDFAILPAIRIGVEMFHEGFSEMRLHKTPNLLINGGTQVCAISRRDNFLYVTIAVNFINGIEVRFVAVELEQDIQKVILSFFKTTSRILVVYFVENSLYVILTNLFIHVRFC